MKGFWPNRKVPFRLSARYQGPGNIRRFCAAILVVMSQSLAACAELCARRSGLYRFGDRRTALLASQAESRVKRRTAFCAEISGRAPNAPISRMTSGMAGSDMALVLVEPTQEALIVTGWPCQRWAAS